MIDCVEPPMSEFASTIFNRRYAHTKSSGEKESWAEMSSRVAGNVMNPYLPELTAKVERFIRERKFLPGGRYLSSVGRRYPQVNNCFLFSAEDSREGWGDLMRKCTESLMTGGGIGVVYSKLRSEGQPITGLGGFSTGPCALMQMVNEAGRHIMQGGTRRSAVWAGLHWSHPDVFKFIQMKNWPEIVKQAKNEDFNFPGPMDGTNISVILDSEFFLAYGNPDHASHKRAYQIYWEAIRWMLRTGEPGFSVDTGDNDGDHLRNACTEVTSSDDSDMCNLGSVNLSKISTYEEFLEVVEASTAFLLCGTLYSKLPLENMYRIREKNRRLGLGLMGVHEWLLRRGYAYGPNDELGKWMSGYTMSGSFANRFADKLSISRPVATRAIAPTGTISIVAETTSGIEPVSAVAYKRRYLEGKKWKAQYVVDATAKRLIDTGVDPDKIEDANELARDVERRILFQSWLQERVDHGISSTINLPSWGSSINNEDTEKKFGETMMKYLPTLRGITAYPDGARGGQPITKVPYKEAIERVGVAFEDNSELICKGGVCGT